MIAAVRPRILTREDVERLERTEGQGGRILSTYLDLEPESQVTRSYRLVFKDLVREARNGLDRRARAELATDAGRVEAWLEEEAPRGRGLAVFSATRADLWETHLLGVPLPDRVAYAERPLLTPLLDVLDEYQRFAVAVVDKERARLLVVFLAAIETAASFVDPVPASQDQGGPAQPRYQRHHEAHVHEHLKRVVARLSEMLRAHRFDRLVLAGPDEATAELLRLLPHELAERLVETIRLDAGASEAEVLTRTLEVERRVERAAEAQLVAEVLEVAPAGGAACGRDAALEALWLRQVETLAVADGLVVPGGVCPVDGRLVAEGAGACPVCGTTPRLVEDVIAAAVDRAIEQDGRVEVVHGQAAERLRDACGGVAAQLRFRL
jgi:peptide subunit release factor 1 (eRF1)